MVESVGKFSECDIEVEDWSVDGQTEKMSPLFTGSPEEFALDIGIYLGKQL